MVSIAVVSVVGLLFLWAALSALTVPVTRRTALAAVVARWPTDRYAKNHAAIVGAVLLGHVVAFGLVTVAVGGLAKIAVPSDALAILFGYPIALAGAVALGLDTPGGQSRDAWRRALGVGAVWYGLVLGFSIVTYYVLAFTLVSG